MLRLIAVACACSGLAGAQAILERALITGHTAPAAGKAGQTTAAGTARVMNRTSEMLNRVGASPSQAARPASTGSRATDVRRSAVLLPEIQNTGVEDSLSAVRPDAVKQGMTREEVLALAGNPYSKITIPGSGGHCSERFTYRLQDGGTLRIVLNDGTVSEVK